MRSVNLLPKDDVGAGRKRPPAPVLAACAGAVLVTAVLSMMYLSASSTVARNQKALDQAQTAYSAIPAPAAAPAVATELPAEKQTRVTALAGVLAQRIAWDRLLRELAQVVPSDVNIVNMKAQSPLATDATGATAAATTPGSLPSGFVVTGCTFSQDGVARFLARLAVVPDLSDVTLGKSEAASSSTGDSSVCAAGMLTFIVDGNLRLPGASS